MQKQQLFAQTKLYLSKGFDNQELKQIIEEMQNINQESVNNLIRSLAKSKAIKPKISSSVLKEKLKQINPYFNVEALVPILAQKKQFKASEIYQLIEEQGVDFEKALQSGLQLLQNQTGHIQLKKINKMMSILGLQKECLSQEDFDILRFFLGRKGIITKQSVKDQLNVLMGRSQ